MSARRSLWLLIAALALAAGCVTPSVPIPPPSPENMAFEVDADNGFAQFEFEPDPSYSQAIVYVFNRDVGAGIITTADEDGAVPLTDPFAATVGDEIIVTFEVDTQLASTCVRLEPGQSSQGLRCEL